MEKVHIKNNYFTNFLTVPESKKNYKKLIIALHLLLIKNRFIENNYCELIPDILATRISKSK